jgi:hypothetical protein
MTPDITHAAQTKITMSASSVARLLEVLDYCDAFLRTTPPAVRAELADFCHARPGLAADWLIDMVGLHALHLRTRLTEAGTPPLPIRRPNFETREQR